MVVLFLLKSGYENYFYFQIQAYNLLSNIKGFLYKATLFQYVYKGC